MKNLLYLPIKIDIPNVDYNINDNNFDLKNIKKKMKEIIEQKNINKQSNIKKNDFNDKIIKNVFDNIDKILKNAESKANNKEI